MKWTERRTFGLPSMQWCRRSPNGRASFSQFEWSAFCNSVCKHPRLAFTIPWPAPDSPPFISDSRPETTAREASSLARRTPRGTLGRTSARRETVAKRTSLLPWACESVKKKVKKKVVRNKVELGNQGVRT